MERNHFWMFTAIAAIFAIAVGCMLRSQPTVASKLGTLAARYDIIDETTGMVAGMNAHVGAIRGANARPALTKAEDAELSAKVQSALERIKKGSTESTPLFQKKAVKVAANKKADKKKKAKKAKKVGEKKEDATTPENKDSDDSGYDGENNIAQTPPVEDVGGVPPVAPEVTPEKETIPQTEAEWAALVLKDPSFANTQLLVKYYLSRDVKADVFYAVVTRMLADTRDDMQKLGVMALGATPSVKSFGALAIYIHAETGDATVKIQATQYLATYSSTSYVRLLGSVLQSSNSNVVTSEALRGIRTAAENLLQGNLPTAPGAVPTANPQASAAQVTYFKQLLTLITRLETTYQDAELKTEASQTIASLQQIVGGSDDVMPASQTAGL